MHTARPRAALLGILMIGILPGGCGDGGPGAAPPDLGPLPPVASRGLADEIIYFVLLDRFANGDPGNDRGGGTISAGGLDPTDARAYHGGDLTGLIDKLDYIEGLGVTALWINPVVVNRAEQPGSRGYHGYWGVDFLAVDPHWGTEADLQRLVDAAHARDMKVFLDIVVNHTADIIGYEECTACPYRPQGTPPYTPVVPDVFRGLKNPAWLDDTRFYNNRGDSTFSGESALYGDFYGLDDLDTSQQAVIDGMVDIYRHWIETYGVDGFRIDTVKHVDLGLWQQLGPALQDIAAGQGIEHFTMFGEVFDYDAAAVSRFTTEGRLPSALDFPLQGAMRQVFSQDGPTSALAAVFRDDDLYTDADSSAQALVSFLGNHDIGRIGRFLVQDGPGRGDRERLARAKLAHAFTLFARGVPVIYYGDEQGFTGDEGGEGARQDMMPSRVPGYRDDDAIGTSATPAADNFDTGHPLYLAIATYASIYRQHAPLRRGIQIHRHSVDAPGLFAFSRVIPGAADARRDDDTLIEYLAVFDTSRTGTAQATLSTGTPRATFHALYPPDAPALASDGNGAVRVSQGPWSFSLYRADRRIPDATAPTRVTLQSPMPGVRVNGRVALAAEVQPADSGGLVGVTFEVAVGDGPLEAVGTDWTPPYQVLWDSTRAAQGTNVRFRAVLVGPGVDAGGTILSDEVAAVVDARVPDRLIIHYENGNGRTRAAALTDTGQMRGPVPLVDGVAEIPVAAGDQAYFLLFEDRAGDRFTFDRPVFATAQTLSAFAREDAGGALFLEVYIDNDQAITGAEDLRGTGAPPVLASDDAAPAPLGGTTLYVRGAMNDWGLSAPMTYAGNYTYEATLTLPPGAVELKIADQAWSTPANFGGPYGANGLTTGGASANLVSVGPAGSTAETMYDIYFFQIPTTSGAPVRFHHVIPTGAP